MLEFLIVSALLMSSIALNGYLRYRIYQLEKDVAFERMWSGIFQRRYESYRDEEKGQ